ncbi:MAG TPA: hypothetical protein VFY89_01450, partial [Ktedonobacterales bacterium]
VKALAELLTTRDASKNHYQGIFSELYRRFGVSSYKTIHRSDYFPGARVSGGLARGGCERRAMSRALTRQTH